MYAMERHEQVEHLLRRQGRVSVVELARRFDITTETVRRDLDHLEREGRLQRVHGGAVASGRGSLVEASVEERMLRHAAAKQAIAARALDAVGAGFRGSIYLDAGTTTAAVAALLPARLRSLGGVAEVVTHAMTIAHLLAGDADPTTRPALNVVGGRVRGVTAAAVGAGTVEAIGRLRPDIAFLGTNGLSAGFGLSTPDPDEAAVKAAIIRAARRVIVVADAGKFDSDLLVSFASLGDVDVVVTDVAPTDSLEAALADAETEIWLA